MKPSIKTYDAKSEYFFAEGCFINEFSNSADDSEVSIAQARLEPGKTTRWHHLLGTTERYVILTGRGRVDIDDAISQEVGVKDVVVIPPEAKQRIENTGENDLVFLVICSPPFSESVYVDDEP
ncbi:MAG: mannose-6-phosphate isomerase-like protein (cupin superfamily) [Halioglobus sp.]|jgi:mannose-6-phosphate isomerase-like protein (cupin superfamily)